MTDGPKDAEPKGADGLRIAHDPGHVQLFPMIYRLQLLIDSEGKRIQ